MTMQVISKIYKFLMAGSVALVSSGVLAQQPYTEPMRFSVERVCEATNCENVIVADGLIAQDSHKKLSQLLEKSTGAITVELNSVGGDLPSAMQLGEVIRTKRLNTRVRYSFPQGTTNQASFRPAECYSACLLSFMGGVNRTLDERARLGVHALQAAPSQPEGPSFDLLSLLGITKAEPPKKGPNADPNQRAAALLGKYIDRMGVDRRTLDFILTATPGRINYIDSERARVLLVDNRSADKSTSQWRINQTSRGSLVGTATETQSNGHYAITLGFATVEADLRLLLHIKPLTSNEAKNTELQQALNQTKAPVLQAKGVTVVPTALKGWIPAKDGFQLWMRVTKEDIAKLAEQPEFTLAIEPSSLSALDAQTVFGTSGLKTYLARANTK